MTEDEYEELKRLREEIKQVRLELGGTTEDLVVEMQREMRAQFEWGVKKTREELRPKIEEVGRRMWQRALQSSAEFRGQRSQDQAVKLIVAEVLDEIPQDAKWLMRVMQHLTTAERQELLTPSDIDVLKNVAKKLRECPPMPDLMNPKVEPRTEHHKTGMKREKDLFDAEPYKPTPVFDGWMRLQRLDLGKEVVVEMLKGMGYGESTFNNKQRALLLESQGARVEEGWDRVFKKWLETKSLNDQRGAKMWLYIAVHPDTKISSKVETALRDVGVSFNEAPKDLSPHELAMMASNISLYAFFPIGQAVYQEASDFSDAYV